MLSSISHLTIVLSFGTAYSSGRFSTALGKRRAQRQGVRRKVGALTVSQVVFCLWVVCEVCKPLASACYRSGADRLDPKLMCASTGRARSLRIAVDENLTATMSQYGLTDRFIGVWVLDQSRSPWRPTQLFDSIITDRTCCTIATRSGSIRLTGHSDLDRAT